MFPGQRCHRCAPLRQRRSASRWYRGRFGGTGWPRAARGHRIKAPGDRQSCDILSLLKKPDSDKAPRQGGCRWARQCLHKRHLREKTHFGPRKFSTTANIQGTIPSTILYLRKKLNSPFSFQGVCDTGQHPGNRRQWQCSTIHQRTLRAEHFRGNHFAIGKYPM